MLGFGLSFVGHGLDLSRGLDGYDLGLVSCNLTGLRSVSGWRGIAQWQGVGLAVERSRVRSPARTRLRNDSG